MNKQTKKILLSTFVIALIIINLSSIATIYYHKNVRSKRIEELKVKKEQMHIGGMHRYIKEELNLDNTQFEQFREAYNNNVKESHNIANKLDSIRYEMISEIAKVNPNLNKLDELSRNIGDLHYELKKLSTSHFLELKGICNEDQQENLQKLFMRMMENHDGDRNQMRNKRNGRNKGERNRSGKDRNRDKDKDFH